MLQYCIDDARARSPKMVKKKFNINGEQWIKYNYSRTYACQSLGGHIIYFELMKFVITIKQRFNNSHAPENGSFHILFYMQLKEALCSHLLFHIQSDQISYRNVCSILLDIVSHTWQTLDTQAYWWLLHRNLCWLWIPIKTYIIQR